MIKSWGLVGGLALGMWSVRVWASQIVVSVARQVCRTPCHRIPPLSVVLEAASAALLSLSLREGAAVVAWSLDESITE